MEHNCFLGVLYAFFFSVLQPTDFYRIQQVSLELKGFKKYFSEFVELDDFFRKQPKNFEKKSF